MAHRMSIKARLYSHGKDEIRRFALPANPTWENCQALLRERFGQRDFTVVYVDPESDEITVRGEVDWQECLRLQEGPMIRLLLRLKAGRVAGNKVKVTEALMPVCPKQDDCKETVEDGAAVAPVLEASTLASPEAAPIPAAPMAVPPKTALELGDEALHLLQAGEYSDALQVLRQACAIEVLPHNVYNIACCHALLKQKAQALACLQEAVFRGYGNWRHMQTDLDLKSVRGEPQFLSIVEALQDAEAKKQPPPNSDSDPTVVSLASSAPASLPDTEPPSSPSTGSSMATDLPASCSINPDALLHEARQHARVGRKFQALKALRVCLAAGQLHARMLEDPDFRALRTERQFLEILSLACLCNG